MIRKYRTILIVLSVVALAAAVAQILPTSSPSLAHFVPQGALVYAESPNLKNLLVWWRDSEFRSRWEETDNYEAFQNSRLYLKLQDRLGEWGAEGSFGFSLDNLITLSGTSSAVALYDIGDLKAVALTEITLAEAQATELWAAKGNFIKRKVGIQNYYVEPGEGVLSFAYARPYLVLASDETLLQQTIRLLQDAAENEPLDSSEKWKLCCAGKVSRSNFSLYLDQERLNESGYFKRYWIQQNVDDLNSIRAAWIDFEVRPEALTERRHFVMNESDTDAAGSRSETGAGTAEEYLKPFRQAQYDLLQLQPDPSPDNVAGHILTIANRFPDEYRKTSYPPAYSAALERALQAEAKDVYRQKIDEPMLAPAAETLILANQKEAVAQLLLSARPVAELRLAYPLWDDHALFVQFPQTVVVQLQNFDALDQKRLLDEIRTHVEILMSVKNHAGNWEDLGSGSFKLNSFHPLFVQFRNPWLVVSNRQQEFNQVVSLLPSGGALPGGSYVEINWENNRWKYSRLMRRLDQGNEDGPLFFSDNVDSLLYAMDQIRISTVERHANDEVVRYHLK